MQFWCGGGAALLFNGCEAATPNEATAKETDPTDTLQQQ